MGHLQPLRACLYVKGSQFEIIVPRLASSPPGLTTENLAGGYRESQNLSPPVILQSWRALTFPPLLPTSILLAFIHLTRVLRLPFFSKHAAAAFV